MLVLKIRIDQDDSESAINFESIQRSTQEENAVFNIISELFPKARANNVGIQSFYIQVKTAYGKTLDDKQWTTKTIGKTAKGSKTQRTWKHT